MAPYRAGDAIVHLAQLAWREQRRRRKRFGYFAWTRLIRHDSSTSPHSGVRNMTAIQ